MNDFTGMPETLKNILLNICVSCDMVNPVSSVRKCKKEECGYLGEISVAQIKEEKSNRIKSFVIKSCTTDSALLKHLPLEDLFFREIYCYEVIFPEYKKFMSEYNMKFEMVPDCFGCYDKSIIMENLTSTGFRRIDKSIQMTEAHMELIFREYAKFHAISFAMKEQNPTSYKRLIHNLNGDLVTTFHAALDTEYSWRYVKTYFDPYTEKDLYDKYSIFADNVIKTVYQYEIQTDFVITHGDAWCTNILFKFENGTVPTSLRFIDFQMARIGSPVYDLSYIFYASANEQLLHKLDKFINCYYESLKNCLQMLGTDAEQVFPYSQLRLHWKQYAKMGLAIAIIILKLVLCELDETPNFEERIEKSGHVIGAFNFVPKQEAEYARRIRNLVLHFYENDLL